MKKIFYYSLLMVLVIVTGCRNEEDLFGQKINGNYQVNAQLESRADSRTAVNEANQVLWLESDKIGVYGDKGSSNVAFSIGQISDEGASATFVGDLKEGEVATTVYYPYDETATLSGNQLTFTLPAEYDYTENSNAPMIGVKQENGSFLFKHLCGLLKFSIMDIPADAARLIVASRGDAAPLIAGSCVVDDITANGAVFSIKEGFDQIVINMDGITGTQTFYVPIPVGRYPEIQVTLEKQDGTTCFSEKLSDVLVQRATIVRVSDDLVDTDKSVEEFIKTSNDKDIYVFMSELEKILKTNENIYEYEIDLAGSEIIYKDGSKQILIFSYDENAFKYSMPSIPKEESMYDWIADVEEIDGFSLISSVDTRASDEDGIFQNTKILRWAPYQDELGVDLDLNTLVAKSPINFTIIGNYANREATSTRLNDNLSEAGIIDIETHGNGGEYIFIPAENIVRGAYEGKEVNTIIVYFSRDLRVKYGRYDEVAVPIEAFERYSFCNDGIVFNNSCESACGSAKSLKNLFMNKGLSTYTGYTDVVNGSVVRRFMDAYTDELFYNLKSNIESIPNDLKYAGKINEQKIDTISGDTTVIVREFEAYFNVATSKEMRFVDFEPEQEAEVTETEIYFPFYLKGVGNLKDDCKVGLLISDKNEVDEEITNANIKNYATIKPHSIGEFSDNANYYAFKGNIEHVKDDLDKSGVGSTGTKYYWICLEYKGRYWISDEYGTFALPSMNMCPDDNHPHMIDLGLPSGIKWACCNIGASSPEEFGGYYAWGEINDIDTRYSYLYYDNVNYSYIYIGDNISHTQYDVTQVLWGEEYCMPTVENVDELFRNSNIEKFVHSDVSGWKIIGPNGNMIFLPAGGMYTPKKYVNSGVNDVGNGYYWLSIMHEIYESDAYAVQLYGDNVCYGPLPRENGASVRSVSCE